MEFIYFNSLEKETNILNYIFTEKWGNIPGTASIGENLLFSSILTLKKDDKIIHITKRNSMRNPDYGYSLSNIQSTFTGSLLQEIAKYS